MSFTCRERTTDSQQRAPREHRVVILGGGFSGLGVAIELLRRGHRDFVLLEKAAQLGGTWRENTYPGCACDVPSQLYSFSYAPNPDWSRVFAEQAEIQAYLLRVAEEHGVLPFVRLRAEVRDARYDEATERWTVRTDSETYSAQVVVTAAGPLHAPKTPAIPGIERFAGEVFHSAQYRHDVPLRGRRVAVIGTGSSAIQMVPHLQREAAELILFQRTAPWVLPKPDHAIPAVEKAAFRYLPGFQKAYREGIYGALELLQLAQRKPRVMDQIARIGRMHLRRQVRDERLREQLTPHFSLGCKRLLLSNTYYPAVTAPNTTLLHSALERVTEGGVVGVDGVERPADVIIFATGFHVTDTPSADIVFGRGGRSLRAAWGGSPRAYLGSTIHGFPNLFFMIGPNLGNGHSSAMVLIEAQAEYIADALDTLDAGALSSFEVRAEVETAYNEEVQAALAGTVWNAGGCSSYYLDASGRNSSIYPWTTLDLRRRLSRFDSERYVLRGQPRTTALPTQRGRAPGPLALRGAVVVITGGARGIGLETGRAFLAVGARVCLGDIDRAALEEAQQTLGEGAHVQHLDVTERASWERFVDTVERELGPVDVLVNNAGVMPTGRFLDEPDEVEAGTYAINVRGPALGMKVVAPRMIGRGRGHIVNVASLAGKLAIPGLATYVGSKHALVGLSAAVREELAGTGVTLSTVMPSAVRTRLVDGIPTGGLFPSEPSDVARAIVSSCRTRRPELSVPGFLRALPVFESALPAWPVRLVRRLARQERVLSDVQRTARASYEHDIEEAGRRATQAASAGSPAP
ncbi:MAG: SDR family NAD(P)-dependent oxidoreductase [Myxococcales bacterium]|nr:SDR family NAD(P)-dependent oxidoreductase [Myxococcales bacterium]